MGAFQEADEGFQACRKLALQGENEASELMCKAYLHGSFHRIQEFTAFRSRLRESLQFAWGRCQAGFEAMLQKGQVGCGEERFADWLRLRLFGAVLCGHSAPTLFPHATTWPPLHPLHPVLHTRQHAHGCWLTSFLSFGCI